MNEDYCVGAKENQAQDSAHTNPVMLPTHAAGRSNDQNGSTSRSDAHGMTPTDAGIEAPTPSTSSRPPILQSAFTERNKEKMNKLKAFLRNTKYGRNEPSVRLEQNRQPPPTTTGIQSRDMQRSQSESGHEGSESQHHAVHDGEQSSFGRDAESVQVERSTSGRSRGRQHGEIHNFYEPAPDVDGKYRCKACKKVIGEKNATRLSKQAIQECTMVDTPVKKGLRRKTKSKNIGLPVSRSEAAMALERAKKPRKQRQALSEDNERAAGSQSEQQKRSSNSTESRLSKRQKVTEKYSGPPQCDPAYVKSVLIGIVEYLVSSGQPFNNFDRREGDDSDLMRLLRVIYPELVSMQIPGSQLLSGRYLNEYYEKLRIDVKKNIAEALDGGYATVLFDGWDDVTSSPVINVLLKMEPSVSSGNRVYFLRSVYTGSKSTGAKEYVRIIEEVMSEYGGLEKVCAITSDNASSCLNARDEITRKYVGVVGVNDQSHVADLLIEDVAKLEWIQECLAKVAAIANEVHNHRKLKERLKDMIEDYNKTLKKAEVFNEENGSSIPGRFSGDRQTGRFVADRDPASVFAKVGEFNVRTAVMLVQSSNTRFASAEGVLDAFLRSIHVLRTLVSENDFNTVLYKPRNAAHRGRVKEAFVDPIEDEGFESQVREIHTILVLLRRYLRAFDSNDARISEVYPFTIALERQLEQLPISSFLHKSEKRKF